MIEKAQAEDFNVALSVILIKIYSFFSNVHHWNLENYANMKVN